jgi:drug/metabolite transporter (DMT)-like permease
VSFAGPLAEAAITGTVEEFGSFDMVETFLGVALIYWWYHADRGSRGYAAGPLMNVGVIIAAVLALPVYFVRSRGWRRGALATAVAALAFAVMLGLGELGEWLGLLAHGGRFDR